MIQIQMRPHRVRRSFAGREEKVKGRRRKKRRKSVKYLTSGNKWAKGRDEILESKGHESRVLTLNGPRKHEDFVYLLNLIQRRAESN